ncbi:hypothetical protein GCM10009117_20840 [Gangjinia marincola]|uniref:Carboxypeptidase-like regulatory domain-containing protein n=1 Tax=Gangjinia marincola TaxID=578463 RepID=A0ABN1MIA7_9FLAO
MSAKFFVLLFLCTLLSQAQAIKGRVFDALTKEPLQDVSVYYDGTTTGVITNPEGYFEIKKINGIAPLIISYTGYSPKLFEQEAIPNNPFDVYLIESREKLMDVVIEADPWSRERKEKQFKKEFLGKTIASQECTILNLEKVELKFSPSNQTLYAWCDEPILIENKHLGYKVSFNLQDFEVLYTTTEMGLIMKKQSFFSGTSFFNPFEKTRKKYIKNRKNTYLGSSMHYLRALRDKKIAEEKFRTFHKGFETMPYRYYNISNEENGLTKISMLVDKLTIVYNSLSDQSMIIKNPGIDHFYIDSTGLFIPYGAIMYSGVFGLEGVGTMLPSDYKVD